MGKIIGIDLGTTNSCVAVMEGGIGQGHRELGRRPHHAVRGRVHQGRRSAGRCPAKRAGRHQPQEHLYAVKRLIGRKFTDAEVKKDLDLVPYDHRARQRRRLGRNRDGKKMAPPEISARC
jgi:molecular chaperone DnaK